MEILSYSFFTVLAVAAVCGGILYSGFRFGFNLKKLLFIILCALFGAFVGARGLYLITSDGGFVWSKLWALNFQEFSLYGGMLVGSLIGGIMAFLMKFNLLKLADLSVIWIGVGIAMMRVGCFVHGCCYGIETDLPWGVKPKLFSQAHYQQIQNGTANLFSAHAIHPTQIYELLAALSGSLIAWWIGKKKFGTPLPSLIFVMWFTFWRLVVWFLRAPSVSYTGPVWLYPVGYVGILVVSISLLLLRKNNQIKKNKIV